VSGGVGEGAGGRGSGSLKTGRAMPMLAHGFI